MLLVWWLVVGFRVRFGMVVSVYVGGFVGHFGYVVCD